MPVLISAKLLDILICAGIGIGYISVLILINCIDIIETVSVTIVGKKGTVRLKDIVDRSPCVDFFRLFLFRRNRCFFLYRFFRLFFLPVRLNDGITQSHGVCYSHKENACKALFLRLCRRFCVTVLIGSRPRYTSFSGDRRDSNPHLAASQAAA